MTISFRARPDELDATITDERGFVVVRNAVPPSEPVDAI